MTADGLPNVPPLDCPDCKGTGTLRLRWKPPNIAGAIRFDYRCETPGCRGTLRARRNGLPAGAPGDSETRMLRVKVDQALGRIWRQAPYLVAEIKGRRISQETAKRAAFRGRALVYRWLSNSLHMGTSESRTSQMNAETCRRALDLCAGVTFKQVVAWGEANPPRERKRRRDGGD